MVVSFHNMTRRMAVIELTGGAELIISRSRKDGSTVGFKSNTGFKWKTLDTQELLDALAYVCSTDEDLIEKGLNADQVKPRTKRVRKPKAEAEIEIDLF